MGNETSLCTSFSSSASEPVFLSLAFPLCLLLYSKNAIFRIWKRKKKKRKLQLRQGELEKDLEYILVQPLHFISGKMCVYVYICIYMLGRFSAFRGNNFSLLGFSIFTTKILFFTLYMFQLIFVMTSKEDSSCVYCYNLYGEMTSLFYVELWKTSLFLHCFDVWGPFSGYFISHIISDVSLFWLPVLPHFFLSGFSLLVFLFSGMCKHRLRKRRTAFQLNYLPRIFCINYMWLDNHILQDMRLPYNCP